MRLLRFYNGSASFCFTGVCDRIKSERIGFSRYGSQEFNRLIKNDDIGETNERHNKV